MKSIKYVVNYILDKREIRNEKETFIIKHNLRGTSKEGFIKQLEANEQYRKYHRKGNNRILHDIISFSPQDRQKISIKALKDIARFYMEKRNPKGMYIAVPHFDKQHVHIHIAYSPLEYKTGKGMRLSRQAFSELKQAVQRYHERHYPELSKSIVNHVGKKKGSVVTDKEYRAKKRSKAPSLKEKAVQTIQSCLLGAKNKQHFFDLLIKNGLNLYKRNNVVKGILLNDRKHRLSTLGFTPDKLQSLENYQDRSKELSDLREAKEHDSERSIED